MSTIKNYSTAAFLVNPEVRAIAVTYEKIDLNEDTTKQMKYTPGYLSAGKLPNGAVIFKSIDKTIKVGDFVIVPTDTRHGMTVCKVVAVDVEIDQDNTAECYWLVGTVDTAEFEQIRQWEENVIVEIKNSAVRKQRDQLSKDLMDSVGNDLPKLELLEDVSPEDNSE